MVPEASFASPQIARASVVSGEVAAKLKENKVNYEIQEGGQGTTILVPAKSVDSTRLDLAAEGLPRGNKGFELFDDSKLGGILRFHIREQGHHVRLAAVDDTAGNNGNEYESRGANDHISLPLAVIIPELQIALFPLCHFLNPFASMCLPKSVCLRRPAVPVKNQTCMRMIS